MSRQLVGPALFAALLLTATPLGASEEMIHPWKQATVQVDTGKSFGVVEVTVKATLTPKPALTALTVKAGGRALALPARALADLPELDVSTLEIRTEPGYDPQPWLYVVFQVPRHRLAAGTTQQWLSFSFQGGQFKKRTLRSRTSSNQYTFKDLPVR
jgi:hypothetical protein